MPNRYDTTGSSQGEYEPGSNDTVLRNLMGITSVEEMDEVELALLDNIQPSLFDQVEFDQQLHYRDLCDWHRAWLGEVYLWAGELRTVNMSKNGYMFAAAHLIPTLINEFERDCLHAYTPCHNFTESALIEALSICHVEFIIIHPFREGNGRLARVLATVMALQAGQPPLDFTWMAENRDEYFQAIQHGHAGNYSPIRQVFERVLQASKHAN